MPNETFVQTECTIRSNQIAHDFNVNSYTIRISFFHDLQSILIPKPTKSDHVFSAFTTSSSLIIINPCQVRPTTTTNEAAKKKSNQIIVWFNDHHIHQQLRDVFYVYLYVEII